MTASLALLTFPAPTLAMITWTVILLAAAFVFVCLFMMLVILVQKPKGGGLSGAFGGAGGGESSFVGAKVGDVLTLVTVGCFVAFLLLAMGLNWTINPIENRAKNAALLDPDSQETQPLDDAADTAAPATSTAPAAGDGSLENETAAGVGADLAATLSDDEPETDAADEPAPPATTPPASSEPAETP